MARTLTAQQQANALADGTRPIFLVHWQHGGEGADEYFSCNGDVTVDGQLYTSGVLDISSLIDNKTATIAQNAEAGRITEIQNQVWRGQSCFIYLIMASPTDGNTFTSSDLITVIDGKIDDSSFSGEGITVTVGSKFYGGKVTPSLLLNDIANHMPTVGQAADWEGSSAFYIALIDYLGGPPISATDATVAGRQTTSEINSYNRALNTGYEPISGDGVSLPIIYGRQIALPIVFADAIFGGDKYLGVAWCLGEVEDVEEIFINDLPMPAGISVRHYLGTDTQPIDSWLAEAITGYGDDMIFYDLEKNVGVCYSVIKITAGAISEVPKLKAVIKGKLVTDSTYDSSTSSYPNYTSMVENYFEPDMWFKMDEVSGNLVNSGTSTIPDLIADGTVTYQTGNLINDTPDSMLFSGGQAFYTTGAALSLYPQMSFMFNVIPHATLGGAIIHRGRLNASDRQGVVLYDSATNYGVTSFNSGWFGTVFTGHTIVRSVKQQVWIVFDEYDALLYIDGVLVDSQVMTRSIRNIDNPYINIGSRFNTSFDERYNGNIGHVFQQTNKVVSAEDIATLYALSIQEQDFGFHNLVSLQPFDGGENSTTPVDYAGSGAVWTPAAQAWITTANSKFGQAARFMTIGTAGENDNRWQSGATIPAFGSNDFSIKTWLLMDVVDTNNRVVFDSRDAGGGGSNRMLLTRGANLDYLRFWSNGGTIITGSTAISNIGRIYVEVSRISGTTYLFVGGNLEGSIVDSTVYAIGAAGYFLNFDAGAFRGGASSMDDLRISMGVDPMAHTTSYTPPTFPHSLSAPAPTLREFDRYSSFTSLDIVFDMLSASDISSYVRTIRRKGGATDSETGMVLNGTDAYLETDDAPEMELLAINSCTEMRSETSDISAGVRTLLSHGIDATTRSIQIDRSAASLLLYLSSDGINWDIANGVVITNSLVADTIFDFCIVRLAGEFIVFSDGSEVARIGSSLSVFDSGSNWQFGAFNATQFWQGKIHAIRQTMGLTRYTKTYESLINSPFSDSGTYTESISYTDTPSLCFNDLVEDPIFGLNETVTNLEEVVSWNRELMLSGLERNRMALVLSDTKRVEEWLDVISMYGDFLWFPEGSDLKIVPDKRASEIPTDEPELATNPDFSLGTTGWAATSPSTITNTIGELIIDRNGNTVFADVAYTEIVTEIGLSYSFSLDIISETGTTHYQIDSGALILLYNQSPVTFVATSELTRISINPSNGASITTIDNFTVKRQYYVVRDWVRGTLSLLPQTRTGSPNVVAVKYTVPVEGTAAWKTDTYTVYKDYSERPVVKTQLELPAVFRANEAKTKARAKTSRMADKIDVSFVGFDECIRFQKGDAIGVYSVLRGVNLVMWVETVEMQTYGRYKVSGVLYADTHFSDGSVPPNNDLISAKSSINRTDSEGNIITTASSEAKSESLVVSNSPCYEFSARRSRYSGNWPLTDASIDPSATSGAIPISGAPEGSPQLIRLGNGTNGCRSGIVVSRPPECGDDTAWKQYSTGQFGESYLSASSKVNSLSMRFSIYSLNYRQAQPDQLIAKLQDSDGSGYDGYRVLSWQQFTTDTLQFHYTFRHYNNATHTGLANSTLTITIQVGDLINPNGWRWIELSAIGNSFSATVVFDEDGVSRRGSIAASSETVLNFYGMIDNEELVQDTALRNNATIVNYMSYS